MGIMETYLYIHDDEVEVIIDVEYDAIYQPAKISGPPEDCYPDESELTITGFKVKQINQMGDEKHTVTDVEIQAEFELMEEQIMQQCWDDFMERRDDCYED